MRKIRQIDGTALSGWGQEEDRHASPAAEPNTEADEAV